ncbi:hybrid sensor histidine kinase/response regulator [Nitratireductor aquimarinus]|uniref:histidine kinase n=1 Tax=Nitratireductor aquimarinus TaxID=889300 RepID=A0ABU4AQ00_9HYPH|nr:hybrid sensor histidine kinase/response regulator [Nitratireductor aquimarinus]MDV6228318.1 hybrid sensor histidine kinase/response regulator [Nitratireductor aquimarinus]
MRDPAARSVGRIVFLTLLCMSIGAAAIGFVAVFGIQSIQQEFERMVEADLPQATVATRLNADISGLTSQMGLLLTARSEIALDTIRIQTRDQLDAIHRQKERLREFQLRPGEYAEINRTLVALVENLDEMAALSTRRLQSEGVARTLEKRAWEKAASSDHGKDFLLWSRNVEAATRIREVDQLVGQFEAITAKARNSGLPELGADLLEQRRDMIKIETTIQGRLNHYTQLSDRLTDATRFMSSRLISEANARSESIQSLIQINLYLILACFLAFTTVGAFIYSYLDKNVVGRIQHLTRKMNAYDGQDAPSGEARNEITQMEASFVRLTNAIAERESRLVALNETAIGARREAEKANKSKSTLLAAASHDLRQPIHAMGLLIGGIDRKALPARSRETVDHLAVLMQETVGLFNSILDMSKLEAGTFTAKQVPVDLVALFSRIEAEISPRAQNTGALIKVEMPRDRTFVQGDENALYRILSNLLVNAIEYAQEGAIELRTENKGKVCTLIVADKGPGLNMNALDASGSDYRSDLKGYGLGLSISFALAAAMKSELTFTSPESGGTQFSLSLQTCEPPVEEAGNDLTSSRLRKHVSGLKIIFLEDSADVHAATLEGLKQLGCSVAAFTSPEQARRAIRNARAPFVLITDLDLGRGHSAGNVIEEALARTPHLISVIITTATRLEANNQWVEHEKIHFIEKPFSIGRLASLIRFVAR